MKILKPFKVYQLCTETLTYKLITNKISISVAVIILMAAALGYLYRYSQEPKLNIEHERLVVLLNQSENERFSPDIFYHYLRAINIAFPDIVYAQAKLESGGWKSNVWKTNNNCFGMKLPNKRSTTSNGDQNGYAYYDTWKSCVLDYALFQARYLSTIKDRQSYLDYLQTNYAEDPTYMKRLNEILRTEPKDTCVTH